MGDFNAEPADAVVFDFCEIYNMQNIIREKTCFKNPSNPCCIDFIIAIRPKSFQNSIIIERGLFDFHKMSITVMKMYYSKQNFPLFITVNVRVSIMIPLYNIFRPSS